MENLYDDVVNQLDDYGVHYYTRGSEDKQGMTTTIFVSKMYLSKEKAEILKSLDFKSGSRDWYKSFFEKKEKELEQENKKGFKLI